MELEDNKLKDLTSEESNNFCSSELSKDDLKEIFDELRLV